MGRTVRLDVGAVDGGAFGDRAGRRKRLDQVSPEPFARPTVEAIVDRERDEHPTFSFVIAAARYAPSLRGAEWDGQRLR